MPTDEEIDHERAKATAAAAIGRDPAWPNRHYIQGVRDALMWVQGDLAEPPLSELTG